MYSFVPFVGPCIIIIGVISGRHRKWRAPQKLWTICGRVARIYFMYITVSHLLYLSLDGDRCVIVGCYNG